MSGKEHLKKSITTRTRHDTSVFPTHNTYFTLNSAPESGCVKFFKMGNKYIMMCMYYVLYELYVLMYNVRRTYAATFVL